MARDYNKLDVLCRHPFKLRVLGCKVFQQVKLTIMNIVDAITVEPFFLTNMDIGLYFGKAQERKVDREPGVSVPVSYI